MTPAIRLGSKPYFDRVAPEWDRLRESFFSGAVRDRAYAAAGLRAQATAADLGAGTGYISEGLLDRGLRVIAVDQSEAMVAQMRSKFGSSERFEARLGDAAALPLRSGEADFAFANMYLHHVEDPGAAIREMTRILRPGGRLVITDLDEHTFEFLRTEHHDRWMGFRRADVAGWLSAAGLHDVNVAAVGEQCCADSADGTGSAKVAIWVAAGTKSPTAAPGTPRA